MRTALVAMVLVAASIGQSEAAGCEEAWYQRNLIYKQAGYCFRTPRAIQAFGNAGCAYDAVEDVPLSSRQRAAVAELRAYEAANRCPP